MLDAVGETPEWVQYGGWNMYTPEGDFFAKAGQPLTRGAHHVELRNKLKPGAAEELDGLYTGAVVAVRHNGDQDGGHHRHTAGP